MTKFAVLRIFVQAGAESKGIVISSAGEEQENHRRVANVLFIAFSMDEQA